MAEYISCDCKCKFNSKTCISKQKLNNKTCQCECKNYHKCDEIVIVMNNFLTKKDKYCNN